MIIPKPSGESTHLEYNFQMFDVKKDLKFHSSEIFLKILNYLLSFLFFQIFLVHHHIISKKHQGSWKFMVNLLFLCEMFYYF
jgi:hypothetical protein